MKRNRMQPDKRVIHLFDALRTNPVRNPEAAARGRANFLQQATVLGASVPRKAERRHNVFSPLFQRKERRLMNALIAVVLAIAVFFGGTGATVYAAQDSLPDQNLYPVKLWSEDSLLSLTDSPLTRLNYILDFSDRRIAELAGLLSNGSPIPERVMTRLQDELEQVLELAASLDDPQMAQELEQIRLRAEAQLQTVTALISGAPDSSRPALVEARLRIQEQLQLAAMGQADPQGFRLQVRQRQRNRGGSGGQTPVPGNGLQGTGTQNPTGTPTLSGGGNGPGPGGNQLGGTPGQYGPGPHGPDPTLHTGEDSGNKP